jgi:hypothetical protein
VPGRDHRWEAAGLADALAASLPVNGGSGTSRSS